MKIMKKAQFKIFVLLTAVLLMFASLWTGAYLPRAYADDTFDESKVTYIDTNVENITYAQHPECVFLGFELSESDYDEFGLFEGDFAGKEVHYTYEKYIALWLTYWKNFSSMNSEGVRFTQLWAYWNGSSVGEVRFANTVAHRSSLKLLEYGFMVSIPAGTTFPSLTYVKGECKGDPIMYKTTEDRAFYFNGSEFVLMPYEVAEERTSAMEELDSINYNTYYEAERAQVKALVEKTKANLEVSFSSFAIKDVMAQFYTALDEIMTVADYQELAKEKAQAKATLEAFFADFVQESYEESDWNTILEIKNEYAAVIDSITTLGAADAAVTSVKFAANSVLTKSEKEGLAAYCAAAAEKVEQAFDAALYREEERAQGAALVQAGKAAIKNASTYGEADALKTEYIERIRALKTSAQWEEEERLDSSVDSSSSSEETVSGDAPEKSGCGSVVSAASGLLLAFAVGLVVIKKKKDGLER